MHDTDTLFRTLKPAALDELADEAHARRRDTDLASAMNTAAGRPGPRWRVRGPVPLIAATAAAVCATGAVVVLAGGDEGPEGRSTPPPSAEQGPVDGRTFLLASATTAGREAPAAPGRYWYGRQLTTSTVSGRIRIVVGEGEKARKADKKISFTAHVQNPGEVWFPRGGGKARKAGGPEKVVFPTVRDKAEWKQDGAPVLTSGDNRRRVWEGPGRPHFGNREVTFEELAALPTDAARLDDVLRDQYARDREDSADPYDGPFTGYVWNIAHDLLSLPLTPGTKAALFEILADQPGIGPAEKVTDQVGRPGMAVTMKSGDGVSSRLVISRKGADLLEYRLMESGHAPVVTTYEASGWVGGLGARP